MGPPRVYAYILWDGHVAVFAHPDPDAGVQVPGGGVEADESLEEAVLREVAEESGLRCEIVAYLGESSRRAWFPERGVFEVERHYFHVVPSGPVAEAWTWTEEYSSDGGGPYELSYRWLTLAAAVDALDFGFGERLGAVGGPHPAAGGVDGDVHARAASPIDVRLRLIDRALDLGATGPVLDIGCGTGELATAHVAARGLDVVGVDVSPASVALAGEVVPSGVFLAADITALSLPLRHFGLVAAFNSAIHVPRTRHPALFRDVHRWLRPGGLFVLDVETAGRSGAGEAEITLLEGAGLAVIEVAAPDTGTEPFTWVVCRRPG